jgi:hypothetical protein
MQMTECGIGLNLEHLPSIKCRQVRHPAVVAKKFARRLNRERRHES